MLIALVHYVHLQLFVLWGSRLCYKSFFISLFFFQFTVRVSLIRHIATEEPTAKSESSLKSEIEFVAMKRSTWKRRKISWKLLWCVRMFLDFCKYFSLGGCDLEKKKNFLGKEKSVKWEAWCRLSPLVPTICTVWKFRKFTLMIFPPKISWNQWMQNLITLYAVFTKYL